MMIKVSIIMAVLNGMPYFPQALESVMGQTLKEIEIIVVDAGSNDGTLEYIKENQATDSRIKLINSDQKSMGRQCNLGIAQANGEYLGFCESDDFLELNMYEDLYEIAINNKNVDAIISDFFMTFGRGEQEQNYKHSLLSSKNKHKYNTPVTYEELPEIQYGLNYMWHSIYPTKFLRDNNIILNETKSAAFQDAGFVENMKLSAKYMYFSDKAYYHYRRDNDNASNYKKCVGLFGLQELNYAMNYHLNNYIKKNGFNNRVLNVLFKHFYVFTYHYSLDKIWNTNVEYQDLVIESQKNVVDFYNKMPVKYQLNCNDNEMFMLFINDLNAYCNVLDIKYNVKCKSLDSMLNVLEDETDVVLFGYGESGKAYNVLLRKKMPNLNVVLCDNNINLRVNGVISPEDAIDKYKDAVYLLTVETAFEPMEKQLLECGVESNRIFRGVNISIHEAYEF